MKAMLGINSTKSKGKKRQSDGDENKHMKAMLGINEVASKRKIIK